MILLLASSLGCVSHKLKNPPPCPAISRDAVEDLEIIILSNSFVDLEIWVSEIERYCGSISSS